MTEGPYRLPEGWRWVRLGEVCQSVRKSVDPRRYPEEDFCLYSIPAYDQGRNPERLKGNAIGSAKLLVESGTCLFSKLNPESRECGLCAKLIAAGKVLLRQNSWCLSQAQKH